MINGKGSKRIYGLLGRNISYSLSPFMHNAAFKHFDIPAEYRLFDIGEKDLDGFFQELISGGDIKGINVTVPYKIKIKEMLEACSDREVVLDHLVKVTGSLNTVKVSEQELRGANTDVQGFWDSLLGDAGFDPIRHRNVFIAGAGGAGRAISIYLAFQKVSERINVYDVDKEKLNSLGELFEKSGFVDRDVFCPVGSPEDIPGRIAESDLVVNATPLGTKEGDPMPIDAGLLKEGTVVYDLVYARETELVARAKARGLKAVNGLGMLVNQGALAFRIWNPGLFSEKSGEPDKAMEELKKVMEDAAKAELKGAK